MPRAPSKLKVKSSTPVNLFDDMPETAQQMDARIATINREAKQKRRDAREREKRLREISKAEYAAKLRAEVQVKIDALWVEYKRMVANYEYDSEA